jgi:hypothetical protein
VARKTYGKIINRTIAGKPQGKILFGKPRFTWQDNNKVDLRDIEY